MTNGNGNGNGCTTAPGGDECTAAGKSASFGSAFAKAMAGAFCMGSLYDNANPGIAGDLGAAQQKLAQINSQYTLIAIQNVGKLNALEEQMMDALSSETTAFVNWKDEILTEDVTTNKLILGATILLVLMILLYLLIN